MVLRSKISAPSRWASFLLVSLLEAFVESIKTRLIDHYIFYCQQLTWQEKKPQSPAKSKVCRAGASQRGAKDLPWLHLAGAAGHASLSRKIRDRKQVDCLLSHPNVSRKKPLPFGLPFQPQVGPHQNGHLHRFVSIWRKTLKGATVRKRNKQTGP